MNKAWILRFPDSLNGEVSDNMLASLPTKEMILSMGLGIMDVRRSVGSREGI
jgi:hypothetical protein